MSKIEFRLDDKHLEEARKIATKYVGRSNCKVCFGRGWTGTASDNTIILCHKCVDAEKAMADWKEYVQGIPELWEHYKDMYEAPEGSKED
jgi:hypothetical protein